MHEHHGHHGPNQFHGHHGHHGHHGYGGFYGNSSNYAICHNETLANECNELHFGSFGIQSPELVPCCLMALYLGVTLARATIKTKTNSNIVYSISFLMVGIMMTFAMFTDSLLPLNVTTKDPFYIFVAIMDVGLTSSIGYSFLIDGLVDAGVLNQKKRSTYYLLFGGMAAIFYGWYCTFFHGWKAGFFVMYMGVVAIGCGTWTLIQIFKLVLSKNKRGLKYFFLAALTGGTGFFSLFDQKLQIFFCEKFTCYWGGDFVWFIVTDTAIYFIYLYYKARHGLDQQEDPVRTLYQRLKDAF